MLDLDVAKTELYEENLSVCAVKDCSVVFKAKADPVSGLLDAIGKADLSLEGSAVAFQAAGKAAALLCVHAKAKDVFAATITRGALAVFKQNKVACRCNQLVDNLPEKTGMAAYEKAVQDLNDSAKAFQALKVLRDKQPTRPKQQVHERFISKHPNEL
jgi:hypothetical protein